MPSAAISFTDANGNECELVLIHGEPPTVLHPDCDGRGLVDEWDDSFACSKCGLESPLSWDWVREQIDKHMSPRKPPPQRVPDISYVHGTGFDDWDEPF